MENVETTNPVTDSVTNLSVIKGVYQAFATGDFPGFLNAMVIVNARYNAKHKITGKVIRAQVTHMWSLKGGKIAKFQQYADTLQVSQAMDG